MTRSHEMQDIALENLDGSIPEERAVLLGETPYSPLDSPQQEDAPAFPPEDGRGSNHTGSDLDSQIQELQNELDRCRMATVPDLESNHVPLEDEPDVQEEEIRPTVASNESLLKSSPTMERLEPNGTKPSSGGYEEPKKAGGSAKRLAAVTVVFLMLMALLLVVLVLETDLAIPVVQNIRQFPSVDSFKHDRYDPFKASMAQKVGGWFKA